MRYVRLYLETLVKRMQEVLIRALFFTECKYARINVTAVPQERDLCVADEKVRRVIVLYRTTQFQRVYERFKPVQECRKCQNGVKSHFIIYFLRKWTKFVGLTVKTKLVHLSHNPFAP